VTANERIENLERTIGRLNGRISMAYAVALLLAFAVVWSSAGPFGEKRVDAQVLGTPKTLEAREFRLVDERGKARAALDVDARFGPTLTFLDPQGKPRLGLFVDKNGPTVLLFHENGKVGAGLNAPGLSLWDDRGNPRGRLAVGKDGARLTFFDEGESVIWKAPG
jgi:hypothetical protein